MRWSQRAMRGSLKTHARKYQKAHHHHPNFNQRHLLLLVVLLLAVFGLLVLTVVWTLRRRLIFVSIEEHHTELEKVFRKARSLQWGGGYWSLAAAHPN